MGVSSIARAIGLVWGQRWEEKLVEDGILHSSHLEARPVWKPAPERRALKTSRIPQLVLPMMSAMEGELARNEAIGWDKEGSPLALHIYQLKKKTNKVPVLFHICGLY